MVLIFFFWGGDFRVGTFLRKNFGVGTWNFGVGTLNTQYLIFQGVKFYAWKSVTFFGVDILMLAVRNPYVAGRYIFWHLPRQITSIQITTPNISCFQGVKFYNFKCYVFKLPSQKILNISRCKILRLEILSIFWDGSLNT